jgi:FkbM family methyltransferase
MFDFGLLGIKPGKCETLVDIGANEGQFLFAALDYFRPRRFLSVEMLPDIAERLRMDPRLAGYQGAVLSCAVGECRQRVPMLRSVFSQASSLLALDPRAADWYGMDLTQRDGGFVEVRTLDEICAEHAIDRIDVLKIDVQGYELKVIRGGERALGRTANLIIEVEFVPVYAGQAPAAGILRELEDRGFELRHYLSQYRNPDGQLLHADVLFQPRRQWEGEGGWPL